MIFARRESSRLGKVSRKKGNLPISKSIRFFPDRLTRNHMPNLSSKQLLKNVTNPTANCFIFSGAERRKPVQKDLMKTNLITFLAISLLLGSCGTTSTLTLQKDGSGNCSVSIHVEKPLIDYFIDMAEESGLYTSGEQAILFDTQRIKTIL